MLKMVLLFLKEELRLRRSFSTALSLLIFPELVLMGAMGGYIFSPIFMGEVTYPQLHLALLSGLFIFGISMGGVAFLGKEFIERSLGPVNMLAASSTYHPVSEKRMYLSYFLHDLLFYIILILLPSSLGLGIGTLIEPIAIQRYFVIISSQWTAFLLGLSLSLMVSSMIAKRSMVLKVLIPLSLVPLISLQLITGELGAYIPAYLAVDGGSPFWIPATVLISLVYLSLGIYFFEGVDITYKKGSRGSYRGIFKLHDRLFKDTRYSALASREMLNILRGKVYVRMAFSLFFPVLVMTLLVGMLGRMEGSPLDLNLPFLAVMLSFFTMSIYTHLVSMDHLDFDQTMPVRTSDLIRIKIRIYLFLSIPISLIFLISVGILQRDLIGLAVSIPLVLVMVPYMGYVTAYLTGLWTNSMLFDSSVFIRYLAMAVGPLMFATLLSMLMDEMDMVSIVGIAVIIAGSAVSTLVLSRSIEKKWNDTVIGSSGGTGE